MPSPAVARLPGLFALPAIWLLTHRYFGIQHDGEFYAVQALARLDPQAFARDPFFAFGSQNDYSLFSHIYAWAIGQFGIGRAALVLLVAAQAVWAAAAFALARRWLDGSFLPFGLALVFAIPGHYGAQVGAAHDVLRYAENFLTARSWAEPLVLAGIAATLGGRHWIAGVALFAGMVCHPIMALPGIVFLAAFHWQPPGRTLLAVGTAVAALAFALPTMDPPWLAEVGRRAPFLLLERWSWGELLEPLAWIGILLAAAHTLGPPFAQAGRALALAGVAGCLLTVLGATTHAALLIQAQPWRSLWVLKITALLALVAMFARLWRRSPADRWLLLGLAAAAMTAQTLGGPVALALALLARFAWPDRIPPQAPAWLPMAGSLALGAILLETLLALLPQAILFASRGIDMLLPAGRAAGGDLAAFFQGPMALLLPAGLALLALLQQRRPATAAGIAFAWLAVAIPGWYRADEPRQVLLFQDNPARPFGELIAPTETVYWPNNLAYTWFLLRQSGYASRQQSASALFSRTAAMESVRRLARIDAFAAALPDTAPGSPPAADAAGALRQLCDDPALDLVILPRRAGEDATPTWFDPLRKSTWHLYRCRSLSQDATSRRGPGP